MKDSPASRGKLGKSQAGKYALALAALSSLLVLASCKKGDPIEMLGPPPTPATLQNYWPLPDFELTERSGKPVRLADLAGKVWVADFIYTTCPGPCPALSTRLADLQKALGNETNVRLVSISTDPETDTPEVLNAYAARFKAGSRWLFLTGKKDAIYALARDGFKLPIAEATAGAPIVHSTRLALVDKTGTVRGFYDGMDPTTAQSLVSDIHRLLDENNPFQFHAEVRAAVSAPYASPQALSTTMTIQQLPPVNASLNALSAIFILLGIVFIKKEMKVAHIISMLTALVTSTIFLACYVTYHASRHGEVTKFTHPGWPKALYYLILFTHIPLAFLTLPLVFMTIIPAFRAIYDKHRRIARWTFPIWLYVSVTGVLVYFMLYQWFPPV